jgi:hypothetical protein
MLYFAARVLDGKVVLSALTGYLIYAAAHFTFHVRHFDHFSVLDAVGVGTGLGLEVVLALVLLHLARRLHQAESTAVPTTEAAPRRSVSGRGPE